MYLHLWYAYVARQCRQAAPADTNSKTWAAPHAPYEGFHSVSMSRSRRKQLEAIPEDLLAANQTLLEGPVGPVQEMLQLVDGLEAAGVGVGELACFRDGWWVLGS